MRPIYLIIGLVLVILISGIVFTNGRGKSASSVTDASPSWTLNKTNGGSGKLEDYKGKVVLINFWASWCGTCRDEMPDIVTTYHKYKDRGLEILGIDYGEDTAAAIQFVIQYGMDFPTFLDPGKQVAAKYGVVTMPSSFLLGRDGKTKEFIPGKLDIQKLQIELERLLAETQ
jgi:peroxiredoxin